MDAARTRLSWELHGAETRGGVKRVLAGAQAPAEFL